VSSVLVPSSGAAAAPAGVVTVRLVLKSQHGLTEEALARLLQGLGGAGCQTLVVAGCPRVGPRSLARARRRAGGVPGLTLKWAREA
jgi:hypothetical protein